VLHKLANHPDSLGHLSCLQVGEVVQVAFASDLYLKGGQFT